MIFAKYEMSIKKWEELKPIIYIDDAYVNCAVVELGQINTLYAFDIMWFDAIPDEFSIYEVFPEPIGIHTFAGCEELYTQRFCDFNPLSQHCNETLR